MQIAVFLPCRAGSQRVVRKNVRPFAGVDGGLTRIKIAQLIEIEMISSIIVSTNDPEVKSIAEGFDDSRIVVDDRPEEFASSSTSTDELIQYVPNIVRDEHILWTHVTSPFIGAKVYNDAIEKYRFALGKGYDSLMSVTKLHKFIWNEDGPLYDVSKEKWPRTQTLAPLYEVNSGIFLASRRVYKKGGNRIGGNPYLYALDEEVAFDVDWEIQFSIAERLYKEKPQIDR